jgi:hypothetical protein
MILRFTNAVVTLLLFLPLVLWYSAISIINCDRKYLNYLFETVSYLFNEMKSDRPVDRLPPPGSII